MKLNDIDDMDSFYFLDLLLYKQQNVDYPDLQSDIMPGISTEGIIAYQAVDPSGEAIKLNFKGNSSDYSIDFAPFIFEIPLQ